MKAVFVVSSLFLWGLVPQIVEAQVLLRGLIRDADTGVTLSAAHVVVDGTGQGTITNRAGQFEIAVAALPATLRVRFIGYQTQRITVGPNDARDLVIDLEPAVYALQEIFVAGEDFASNVMRRVIERKKEFRAGLQTYQVRGYTRLTLENASRIALISEAVYDSYWERSRGPRDVVKSKRETADFYRQLQLEPAGFPPNLYDDEIEIQGLRFIGPTHPNALDVYTFSLADRRMLDGKMVYDLYIAPKTGLEATFIGRLAVLDEEYTLLEVDVRPARHVVFPLPVKAWDVFYRQQFAAVADTFWLPIDLRLDGTIRVDPGDIGYSAATLRQVSHLTTYEVNTPVPDSLYARSERILVDSASVFKDDLFLLGRNIVSLTPREAEALEVLRAEAWTLEQAFPPRGKSRALAAFEARRNEVDGPQFAWPVILGYEPWLRFNRVDGFFSGIGKTLALNEHLLAEVRVAQASGLRRVRFTSGLQYRRGMRLTVGGRYTLDTSPRPVSSIYPPAFSSLAALVGQGDYFDYYWNKRYALSVSYAFRFVRFSVEGRWEDHASVEREQAHPWPFLATFRSNPAIDEGRLHTVSASLAVGDGYKPFRFEPLRRFELEVEYSHPDYLGGDFDFVRVGASMDGYIKTLVRSRPRSNGLSVRAYGGTYSGTLPLQRFGVVDGSLGGFSTLGTLRTLRGRPYEGERYLGVFWEHDFRTLPFEALGMQALVDRNMGVRLFGGHGRTWIRTDRLVGMDVAPRYIDRFHHELGLSFTNLWGSPLRLDLAYRLDDPGVFLGFGLSRLF